MSILIKGMKMPECCDKCPFKSYVGVDHLECKITGYRFYVWEVGWCDGTEKPYIRHESCPLIEVPPHGRLIDADTLKTDCDFVHSMMMFGGQKVYTQTAIDNAPTIIEADYPPSIPLKQVWEELFGEDGER